MLKTLSLVLIFAKHQLFCKHLWLTEKALITQRLKDISNRLTKTRSARQVGTSGF
jgi:hypothetical protein